jgi:purine-binding chemotaxis protein CheW
MSEQANHQQLVVFTLGAEHYALPIQAVNEIIRYAEPRSVASRTDWVAGAETAGVIVDTVEEVLTVSSDQIEEAPGADSSMIEAIVRIDERLIVLLTLSTIFETNAELSVVAA